MPCLSTKPTKWFAVLVEHETAEPRVEMNSNDASLAKLSTGNVREDAARLCFAVVRQTPALGIATEQTAEVVAVRVHVNVGRTDTDHLQNRHTDSVNGTVWYSRV